MVSFYYDNQFNFYQFNLIRYKIDIFELLCKEENDSNLCPEHEIQTATCKNKNYQLKRLPNFHCIYENLKEDVSVKDYDIKCKEFNRFSYYKDTCSLVYILQYKKTNDKDDEQNKKTDPLVYFIYILGLLSGLLLLSVIAYISYKQMRKYRTRRFSVYPD